MDYLKSNEFQFNQKIIGQRNLHLKIVILTGNLPLLLTFTGLNLPSGSFPPFTLATCFSTFSASSVRPQARSHRDDSGIHLDNATMTNKGMEDNTIYHLHDKVMSVPQARKTLNSAPKDQNPCRMTRSLPRISTGAYSANNYGVRMCVRNSCRNNKLALYVTYGVSSVTSADTESNEESNSEQRVDFWSKTTQSTAYSTSQIGVNYHASTTHFV